MYLLNLIIGEKIFVFHISTDLAFSVKVPYWYFRAVTSVSGHLGTGPLAKVFTFRHTRHQGIEGFRNVISLSFPKRMSTSLCAAKVI